METHEQRALERLTFYRPAPEDVQPAYALIARCDVRDYGEPDTLLDDVKGDWEQIDQARDAWLAAAPDGMPVGYAAIKRWRDQLEFDLYVDPAWEETGLGQALLDRCMRRGQAIARQDHTALSARTYVAHGNRRQQGLVERAGFALAKVHFQMRISLDAPPPAPAWPPGVSVRTAQAGQDETAIHALVEAAFAWPGRTATTFKEWQGLMVHVDHYDPDLWFLAVAGEALVGVCLCLTYPEEGWVRQLAVDARWRRQGIGGALLRHAFGVFHERGYAQAGLAVEGANADARVFYEQIGMRALRQHDEYARTIHPTPVDG